MVVLRDSRIGGEATYTSSCRTSPTSREQGSVDGGSDVENQIATKRGPANGRCLVEYAGTTRMCAYFWLAGTGSIDALI